MEPALEANAAESVSVNSQLRRDLYAEEMFGGAALIVVGEPTSEEHKNAILERISQGKSSMQFALVFFLLKLNE